MYFLTHDVNIEGSISLEGMQYIYVMYINLIWEIKTHKVDI